MRPLNHLIVSVSTPRHAQAWEVLLRRSYPNLQIHVVDEDWQGKAGNGLGTLYAFHKANQRSDLIAEMEKGASVTIYHTAGSAKRLYPLVAVENNNKGALQLPSLKEGRPLTLLEAVIQQTMPLAEPGRLSVFWGDQLFFPSIKPRAAKAAIEIFSKKISFPTPSQWEKNHLERYGLIARSHQKTLLFDKISRQKFQQLIDQQTIDSKNTFATSLGCFSINIEMLQHLLDLFDNELQEKRGNADTDPHFWMPLILDQETYLQLRGDPMKSHYQRMQKGIPHSQSLFDTIDIGADGSWWDFGSTSNYFDSVMALTRPEGQPLREFFQITKPTYPSLDIDPSSVLINCSIGKGRIRNSVLVNVVADEINIEDSVLIGAGAQKISSYQSLGYKIRDRQQINLSKGSVRSDWFNPRTNEWVILETTKERCGKEDWEQLIGNNAYRWSEVEMINSGPSS